MRKPLLAALCLVVASHAARAADGRFLLLVADEPPSPDLVAAAQREAVGVEAPLAPNVARERIDRIFPRLFASGRTVDKSALEADLKAGRAAHFGGQYADAEAAFVHAFESAAAQPELLDDAKLMQRLVDGAATRYKNTLARKRPKAEAKAQVAEFLQRYPLTSPTASDFAPEVMTMWNEARTAAKASFGSLVVGVRPLELERSGQCKLYLNGAELADLPQPGELGVPHGEHFVQVRCGAQISWLQRITVGTSPVSLTVPVRAMLSARGDAASGGITLVAPSPGDAAALVATLARSTDLAGATVVIVSGGKVKLGRWDPTSETPILTKVGKLEGGNIVAVHAIGADKAGTEESGGGRLWTWVVGGVGLATLGGAVVLNVVTANKIKSGDTDYQGLKTATIALYAVGGALVAAGLILFFVEGDGDDGGASASVVPGPGGLMVRF